MFMPVSSYMAFLKSPMFKYLMIVLAVLIVLFMVYRKGVNDKQMEWDLAIAEAERVKAEMVVKEVEVTTKEVIKYVDKVRVVSLKGATITKYVDKYITKIDDSKCSIPTNFILIHDAAVLNKEVKGG